MCKQKQCTEECAAKRKEQYDEFSKAIKSNPDAKNYINQAFALYKLPEWPMPYFQARDVIWPEVFGKEGCRFLQRYIIEGIKICDDISKEDKVVLDNWYILYNAIARRAESYSIDPMGFNDFYSVFNVDPKSYTLRAFRNDGQFLNMDVNPENVHRMIHRLMDVLVEVENVYGEKINRFRLNRHLNEIQ